MPKDTRDADTPPEVAEVKAPAEAAPPKLSDKGRRAMQGVPNDQGTPRTVKADTAKSSENEGPSLASLRQKAVRDARADEMELVRASGYGTRSWTPRHLKTLEQGRWVRGYEGHHIKDVAHHPKWAGDRRNIDFATKREHIVDRHHRDTHQPTTGNLIDRPKMIRMARANQQRTRNPVA